MTHPWPLTSPHLENDTSNTPNIDLGVIATLLRVDDLGSHPEDGSLHRSVDIGHVDVFGSFRDTKVGDFADARGLHQYVIRF